MPHDGAAILHADLDAFYASVEQLLDPELARQAHRRRRRRGARRVVRGQGARCPGRDAGLARPPAVPRAPVRGRSLPGVPAARRRGHRRASRLHTVGRAHLDRRGVPRRRGIGAPVRRAGVDRGRDPAAGSRRARASGVGGGRHHQAPRQGRVTGRQTRRRRRRGEGHRTGLPGSPSRRAVVGRRARHPGAAACDRDPHHRRSGAVVALHPPDAARTGCGVEARRPRRQLRSAPHRDRSPRPVHGRAVRARTPHRHTRAAVVDVRLPRRPGRDRACGRTNAPGAR